MNRLQGVELVVFDMAGTTVVDRGEVPAAFAAALAEHGLSVTTEQLHAIRGSSKRQAAFDLIPEGPSRAGTAAAVYASFRQRLTAIYDEQGVAAVDGAERVFAALRSRGVGIALNTGFDREITGQLLSALRWNNGHVDAVVCGDDVKEGRPAPYLIFRAMEATGARGVHAVANVGDTALDLHAGHNAGVRWNIGVLSGAHDRGRLEAAPHTHLFPSITGLLEIL